MQTLSDWKPDDILKAIALFGAALAGEAAGSLKEAMYEPPPELLNLPRAALEALNAATTKLPP